MTGKINTERLTAPICNAASVGNLKGITPNKTRQADLDLFKKKYIFTVKITINKKLRKGLAHYEYDR